MDHCVTVNDENPWLDVRCHLLSFHEDSLNLEDGVDCVNRLDDSKLSAKFYYAGAPCWLERMGTRLHEVTQTDEALTAKMEKALTGEDTSEPLEDICRQRRENMVLMNNYVSCISLYIGLCEKIPLWGFDDHPHFKAIADYFKINHLDHAGLECVRLHAKLAFCCASDPRAPLDLVAMSALLVLAEGVPKDPETDYMTSLPCDPADVLTAPGAYLLPTSSRNSPYGPSTRA